MRHRLLSLPLLLTFIVFCSCSREPSDEAIIIDATSHDFTEWSSVFEVVDTIPLQQTEQSLVSYTEDMILCDDGFLLIDMKSSKVMKFGFDGKFLYSSGELGRANNEYLRPLDICLSSDKKQYVLLDETGLLYYDIADGHFIKKEKSLKKINIGTSS